MAIPNPAPDPIEQDLQRLLADPEIRASLEESEARAGRGETVRHSHEDARRILKSSPGRDFP